MNIKSKVRKQFILDPQKIKTVKQITGARTETEAIDKALDIIIANDKIIKMLKSIRGKGRIKDIYGKVTH